MVPWWHYFSVNVQVVACNFITQNTTTDHSHLNRNSGVESFFNRVANSSLELNMFSQDPWFHHIHQICFSGNISNTSRIFVLLNFSFISQD